MLTLLMVILSIYVAWRLPYWFAHSRFLTCLSNWCRFRRWNPCEHTELALIQSPVDVGEVVAVCEYVCAACGVAFLKETVLHREVTEDEAAQLLARILRAGQWQARQEQVRLWLARWVLPACRELRHFCTFLGTLAVLLLLGAWLTWGWIGPDVTAHWQSLSACMATSTPSSAAAVPLIMENPGE